MAAYEVLLLNTAVPQIQAAQSGDTYVVPRDIAFSAALTLSAGTANGVAYLNGSKVLTTGSALTFDGTNLGIGTSSPGEKLDVNGNVTFNGKLFSNPAASISGDVAANLVNTSATGFGLRVAGGASGGGYALSVNNYLGSELLQVNGSGNLGLGVTPSAWSGWKAYQVDGGAVANISSVVTAVGGNWYADGVGDKYYANGAACRLDVNNSGGFQFKIAPSGTAGNTITFTQVMTLTDSGNLGIGATSVDGSLHIAKNNALLHLEDPRTTGDGSHTVSISAYKAFFGYNNLVVESASLRFNTVGSERARITSVGNFSIGGTADRATTVGTKTLNIFDGTAPVGTLANGVSFYSASGEANVMDAAGNATLLSPHDTETNEWIFRSKHTPTGKVLRIDVERLLRFVNAHFGLDAVKEFVEE